MSIWFSRASNKLALLQVVRTPGDAVLFCRVLLFAVMVPFVMRLNLPSLERLIEPRGEPPALSPAELARVIKTVNHVLQMGTPLVPRGCLTRGITRYYFFRRAGMNVMLVFGMGKRNGEYVGHCWLARDGEPYLEPADPRPEFAELYSIPSAALNGANETQYQFSRFDDHPVR